LAVAAKPEQGAPLPVGQSAGGADHAATCSLLRGWRSRRGNSEQERFGTRLVSSSLSAFGEVSLDYAPTGLILRLDAPLQKLQYKNCSDAEE